MSLKTLYITHASALGGAELSLVDLISEKKESSILLLFSDGPLVDILKKREIPFEILKAPPHLLEFTTKRSKVLNLFILIFEFVYFEIRFFFKVKEYKTVVTNSQKAHFLMFIPNIILRKKWIVYYRDHLNVKVFGWLLTNLSRIILNNGPRFIIANSMRTKKALEDSGVNSQKIEAIYNFFSFQEKFSPKKKSEITSVLYPSRLSEWKGQLEFLESLSFVKKKLEVTIIKDTFFNENKVLLSQEIQEKIKKLPVNIKVNVLPLQKDMSILYADCDFVLHAPTREEPMGRVMVEAISYCRPLIVSENATIDGFLKDKINCAIIKVNDPMVFAKQLEDAVSDYGNSLVYAKRAFEEARVLFSKKNTVERFFYILER
jgi:glycosyltransferase involved in cell wall biosynthesis